MDDASLELQSKDIAFGILPGDIERLGAATDKPVVIGQPRALAALKMGTEIRMRGYNVFVTGLPGTGRRTAVMKILSEYTPATDTVKDLVFVCNFRHHVSPVVLSFPRGKARKFRKDIHAAVENVKRAIAAHLESDSFRKDRDEMMARAEDKENKTLSDFESELAAKGFRVVQVGEDSGQATDIVPVVDGEPVGFDDLQEKVAAGSMTQEEWNAKREQYYQCMDRMKKTFEEIKTARMGLESMLENLRDKAARPFIKAETDALAAEWTDAKTVKWLEDFGHDMSHHIGLFIRETVDEDKVQIRSVPLARYGVNVIVDSADTARFPVVYENHPTFSNLFGSIEASTDGQDDIRHAHMKIRSGSFMDASGGFLVLKAEDLVQDEEIWTNLKRVLHSSKVEIQPQSGPYGQSPVMLKPEPVDIDVKVIVIGNEMSYDALYNADQDFRKLFKVSAEFDSSMPRNDESTREYLAFFRKIAEDEKLLGITSSGAAAVMEYGVKLSDYRMRLSTEFSRIADLLRESDYRARQQGKTEIDSGAVLGAIQARAYLYSLPAEKFQDMIVSGEILLDVKGKSVGRLNGLAVHDRGYYAFGLPAVISARVAPGDTGVVNIEGESGLSGEIYDKAVLIVEGFLRSRYARDFPLSVTASICFEQSYTAVEGDSASSTAVYALLSAIAKIPLRQDIAVTGSVNQMGNIQPVGGVSEKIEGFYDICRRSGLTGTQGVMIPRQNIVNLTLPREIQDAVGEGTFHLYAVRTIDEGLTLLSGVEAGVADKDGTFPERSFNGTVARELKAMAELIRAYGRS